MSGRRFEDVVARASALPIGSVQVGLPPEIVCALGSAIVVFVAPWSCASVAMLHRVTSAAAFVRGRGEEPVVVVMDAESDVAAALARRLGVHVLGWGETCWVARGVPRATVDAVVSDGALRAHTLDLLLATRYADPAR